MNWTIRRAGLDDAEALALLGAATFLTAFADVHTSAEIVEHCRDAHSVAAYHRLLAPSTDAWLVETASTGAPVGYAVLTEPGLELAGPGDLELRRIYLLPGLHGGGAGAALMQLVIERARERGARRLLLGVYSLNGRALAYYRKHGFEQIGEHDFLVGETVYVDFVMARPV